MAAAWLVGLLVLACLIAYEVGRAQVFALYEPLEESWTNQLRTRAVLASMALVVWIAVPLAVVTP